MVTSDRRQTLGEKIANVVVEDDEAWFGFMNEIQDEEIEAIGYRHHSKHS